jgi:hypothetical protein
MKEIKMANNNFHHVNYYWADQIATPSVPTSASSTMAASTVSLTLRQPVIFGLNQTMFSSNHHH